MIPVSIGICAYNEEKNIGRLLNVLLNQKTKRVRIKEIVVVSSGSTDRTDEIVKEFSEKDERVELITQPKRMGKASAVNEFLKRASEEICVLESADTLPLENTIELLCVPFHDKKIGMTGGRAIPTNSPDTFMGFVGYIVWELRHEISLTNPRFGELIAFRKVIDKIPENTAVDEAWIEAVIKKMGYKTIYVPEAICYNTAPETISDFIKQRRRIYYGHLHLKKELGYEVSTLSSKSLLKYLNRLNLKPKEIAYLIGALFLEGLSRSLGMLDFYVLKKDHAVWDIAESTKVLRA